MRCDAREQLALPVEPLGDRLDHEIAFGEAVEVLVVVRGPDVRREAGGRERRGIELRESVDRATRDAGAVAVLRGEVEQPHGHPRVDEVRGDLRPHHAGPENGGPANLPDGFGTHAAYPSGGPCDQKRWLYCTLSTSTDVE